MKPTDSSMINLIDVFCSIRIKKCIICRNYIENIVNGWKSNTLFADDLVLASDA